MAIKIYLQSIDGRKESQVYDLYYSLTKLWPIADPSFPLLQYIDPYGNVVFNGSQALQVINELKLLMSKASSDEQKKVLADVIDLAMRCKNAPHTYLRFRGD